MNNFFSLANTPTHINDKNICGDRNSESFISLGPEIIERSRDCERTSDFKGKVCSV